MDSSGNIFYGDDEISKLDKEKQKKLVEIFEEELGEIESMDNNDRRAWYIRMKEQGRKFPIPK